MRPVDRRAGPVELFRLAGVLAVVLAAESVLSGAAAAALPKSCPSASVVSAALGLKSAAPSLTRTTYAVVCTFRGGAIPTKMTFQVDTAGTFAASEKAVAALGVVAVHGVGRAAWAPKAGGDLNVFTGSETIKILAPLVSPPRSRRWPRSSSNPLSRP